MDHLNPLLNEAKNRLGNELDAALDEAIKPAGHKTFSTTWRDRNLVVEQGNSIIATYRTLWLNQQLRFEDGSPKQVAELIIGLDEIVD